MAADICATRQATVIAPAPVTFFTVSRGDGVHIDVIARDNLCLAVRPHVAEHTAGQIDVVTGLQHEHTTVVLHVNARCTIKGTIFWAAAERTDAV
ncbi:hypothetical protein D3C80_864380 [compost metagenome]